MKSFLTALFFLVLGTMSSAQTNDADLQAWIAAQNANLTTLQTECDSGNIAACGTLGTRVLNGEGVPQDFALAFRLLQTACEAGFAWPCHDLGVAAQRGIVTGGHETELHLHWKGCSLGAGTSCIRIGALLLDERLQFPGFADPDDRKKEAVRGFARGCLGVLFPDPESCERYAKAAYGSYTYGVDPVMTSFAATLGVDEGRITQSLCVDYDEDTNNPSGCDTAADICRYGGPLGICDLAVTRMIQSCESGNARLCASLLHLSIPARGTEDGGDPHFSAKYPSVLHDRRSVHLRAAVDRWEGIDWAKTTQTACQSNRSGRFCLPAIERCRARGGYAVVCEALP